MVATEGLEAFAGNVRMFADGEIAPFPTALFADTWPAAPDTTLAPAPADRAAGTEAGGSTTP